MAVQPGLRVLVLADMDDLPPEIGHETVDLVMGCDVLPQWILFQAVEQCGCNRIMEVKSNHDPEAPFAEGVGSLLLPAIMESA